MEGWESVGVRGVDDNIAIQALMEDIIERKGEGKSKLKKRGRRTKGLKSSKSKKKGEHNSSP